MDFIKVSKEERISHIFLDRGKSNAINGQMLEELGQAIAEASEDTSTEGIILHGKEGFFSAGLDLVALYECNEAESRQFWKSFMAVVRSLVGFSKPAIAAISGHSPAGGCVLALGCDARIMAEGDHVIGLNEVGVGIIVPESIFQLYAFWLGHARAYRYLLEGKLLNPQEALEVGLVDEVTSPRMLRTAAQRQLQRFMQYERNTWRESKLNMRKHLLAQFDADQEEAIKAVLRQWWAPTTRSIVRSIIDNLKAR
jgi:Enoyl-CoA hydratase/carnithine racemase